MRVAARRFGCLSAWSTDMYSSNNFSSGEVWSASPFTAIWSWCDALWGVIECIPRNWIGIWPGLDSADDRDGTTKASPVKAEERSIARADVAVCRHGRMWLFSIGIVVKGVNEKN